MQLAKGLLNHRPHSKNPSPIVNTNSPISANNSTFSPGEIYFSTPILPAAYFPCTHIYTRITQMPVPQPTCGIIISRNVNVFCKDALCCRKYFWYQILHIIRLIAIFGLCQQARVICVVNPTRMCVLLDEKWRRCICI